MSDVLLLTRTCVLSQVHLDISTSVRVRVGVRVSFRNQGSIGPLRTRNQDCKITATVHGGRHVTRRPIAHTWEGGMH